MSIAFTTSPTDADWDATLQGWRCPVLKIPGAHIDAVFTPTGRIDKAWYEVLSDLNVVRWVHDSSPPSKAAFSVVLTQELSTQELTAKWKKLAILLPVLASVFVALLSTLVPAKKQASATLPATPTPTVISPFHVWTVNGKVKPTTAFAYYEVTPTIIPPDLRLKDDWSFEGKLPIEYSETGRLEFPSIILKLNKPGFVTPVVHLANPGDVLPAGNADDYGQTTDAVNHVVTLTKPIEFHATGATDAFHPTQEAVPKKNAPTKALAPK